MSTDVRRDGLHGEHPGREATPGEQGGRRRRSGQVMPDARPTSYYGQPILNPPTWQPLDIAGYLFLGGLAGASSVLAGGAQVTGRRHLRRVSKVGAAGAIGVSLVALVHDLGKPSRFVNMLRVFKPSSPMSMGSWLLAAYAPAAGVAAASELTGIAPGIGALATAGAAILGTGVATYTGALIADTAVPAWHDGWREMPLVFAGSAAASAGGLALVAGETGPARRVAIIGASAELALTRQLEQAMPEEVAVHYREGTGGRLLKAAKALTGIGIGAAAFVGRARWAGRLSGLAFLAGSACLRFGIFHAGVASAKDPLATVGPQRRRSG